MLITCDDVIIQKPKKNQDRINPQRASAKANGEPRYEGKQPCSKGHGFTKYTSTGSCVICCKEQTQKIRNRDPEYTRKQAKRNWLWATYKLSIEQYDSMIIAQNNKCAICETSLDLGIHVDHCHDSGKVRALLCPACNKGIGHFFNNPDILIKAAKYCKDHG